MMNSRSLPMPRSTVLAVVAALFAVVTLGCSGPVPSDDTEAKPAEAIGMEPGPATTVDPPPEDAAGNVPHAPPAITLETADADRYAEILDSHRGKVVLVDFWATWCPHCVEQFPHTVKLHQELAGDGLAVVSVSMDDESEQAEALQMLRKFGATFDNLRSQHGAQPEAMEGFQIEGLPSYKLYDRQGKLRDTLADDDPDRPLATDDIDTRVRELLAEQ